jgi:hypothetical protein
LNFVGEGRGMKDLGRSKSLFGSFKKIRKGFGVFILSHFKVPPN